MKTPLTDTLSANERHNTVVETRYWCDQYKTLARKLEADNAELVVAIKGGIAALTQPATFPADVAAAVSFLRAAIAEGK